MRFEITFELELVSVVLDAFQVLHDFETFDIRLQMPGTTKKLHNKPFCYVIVRICTEHCICTHGRTER